MSDIVVLPTGHPDERYKNGKIYLIKCNKTGLGYVGSTIQPLRTRLQKHETDYRGFFEINNNKPRSYRASADILCNEDYTMELLEEYSCNNKRELEQRESLWIFKMSATHTLTNKNMPYRIGFHDMPEIEKLKIIEKKSI
tara:strand:+ start:355 stop:774 length:420 start_codon:yes stop_codon:yes gene_type:complete